MPLIFGIDTVALNPETTPGTIPVGAVISMMGVTGSFPIPATGVVSGGFMLCDGAAIPGGQVLSGSTPNLTGNVYLRGSASAGATGGANSKTLNSPQLPSHGHPLTISDDSAPHNHPGSSSTEDAPHSHPASTGTDNAPHGHPGGAPNEPDNAPHSHPHRHGNVGRLNIGGSGQYVTSTAYPVRIDDQSDDYSAFANAPGTASHSHNTGSVPLADATHSHPATVNANNAPHSHTITVGSANAPHSHPGSSVGTTGAGDSINFEPNYMTCQYLIRVA